MPESGFFVHELAMNILTKELHLSDEEKSIKHNIEKLIQQLKQLEDDLKQRHSDLLQDSFDHFAEVRRKIDLHREELKDKIDKIALKMIDQVTKRDKAYNLQIEESLLDVIRIEFEKSMKICANELRKPNLAVDAFRRLQNDHELKIREMQAKINEFDSLNSKIK